MNKLLWLGGCVTASPITADVAISEVDDGRPFAGNYKDTVWIRHLWDPHKPISTKYRINPMFSISCPSVASMIHNGQSCRFIIWSDTGVISRRGDGVEWMCADILYVGLSPNRCIPHPHRFVIWAGHNAGAISGEGDGLDSIRMPQSFLHRFTWKKMHRNRIDNVYSDM